MSVTHEDFYLFAEGAAKNDQEIDWRNACSRTYYAAFHLAQGVAQYCPDNLAHLHFGSHERLIKRFATSSFKSAKSIGYVLEAMKKQRNMADYEITDPFDRNFCVEQFATYKTLKDKVTAFENLCNAPP